MKIKVITYKESGKWYDTFEVEFPNHLQVFDKPAISKWLIETERQCNHMDFTYEIDDVSHLYVHP